jgi:ABC-2 type transport system permease protein
MAAFMNPSSPRPSSDRSPAPPDPTTPDPSHADQARTGTVTGRATAALATTGADLHGGVATKDLTRLLLRLRWTLWRRSFRKNVGKVVGTVIGGLYGLGGMVGLFAALGATAVLAGDPTFPTVIRGVGTVVVLAWFLLPLLGMGLDDTLDPRRFATFPRTAKELQPGLLAASTVSLPSLFTVLGTAIATIWEVVWLVGHGAGVGWSLAAVVLLIPANLAGLLLCLLLPRAVMAHSSTRSTSRSRRELGGVFGIVLILAVAYGFSLFSQSFGEQLDSDSGMSIDLSMLLLALRIGAWTPFGALFSVPMDLAQGHVLAAIARMLIGGGTIAVVWLWWRRSVDRALRSALVGDASSGQAKVTSLVPRFVRPTPFGAVMGRSLRYWKRDSRYLSSLVVLPVMLVFFVLMGTISSEQRFTALFGVVLVAATSGITLANEVGFDGPSGWVNITAGLPGRDNLRGRVAAMALFAVPATIVIAVVVPLIFGYVQLIPLLVLGTLGLMAGGWGASAVIGTLMPYPTAPPGTNPMKDKSANNVNAMIAMALSMAATFVPQVPAIVIAIWGAVVGSQMLQLIAGGIALVVGVVLLVVGLHVAAKLLDARYVDVYQKVRAFV